MSTVGNIKNMHYDFKQKLNKLDSNAYRGLQIPEIDRKLNEALNLYILLIAQPRIKNQLGIETSQRTIDDISILVVDDYECTLNADIANVTAELPTDYMYYLSTEYLLCSKDECKLQRFKTFVIQHDDNANQQIFYKPSFDWRETTIRFFDDGIKVYTNGEFTVDKFTINYIKQHPYMHNADDFANGTYYLPNNVGLSGYQDCLLPDYTHQEIVDLAVLIATGDLESQISYQFKQNKLQLTQLKLQ